MVAFSKKKKRQTYPKDTRFEVLRNTKRAVAYSEVWIKDKHGQVYATTDAPIIEWL